MVLRKSRRLTFNVCPIIYGDYCTTQRNSRRFTFIECPLLVMFFSLVVIFLMLHALTVNKKRF